MEQSGESLRVYVENGVISGYMEKPSPQQTYTLEELVAQITEENRHDEIDWGEPQGEEAW
jgi:antitoxin MazE